MANLSDYYTSGSGGGATTLGALTDVGTSSADTGEVLTANSDGTFSFAPVTDSDNLVKSYRYDGDLAVNTGEKRLYLEKGYTLVSAHAYIDTAPTGDSVNLQINKNGSSLFTMSVNAGASTGSSTGLTHSISANDYITVDITQVGSSTAGSDLYVVFTFE